MSSWVSPDFFATNAPAAWPFDGLEPQAYNFIMADPASRFENYSEKGEKKSPQAQYETMTWDEIFALPVADLARDHCLLWLWGTWPTLPDGLNAMRRWGFEYVTGGAWDKVRWGNGYVVRSLCEPFLIGKRGAPLVDGRSIPNLIRETRREHSRKPERAYELAEKMMPQASRRADLFSRQSRQNWETWGNEKTLFDNERETA